MDEYEVDLMDYIQVMWKGKWIILACLIVAIASSAAIMWTRPNEYSGSTNYQLYESLSPLGISSLDKQEVVDTFLELKREYEDEQITLNAETDNSRIRVSLAGPVSQDDILTMFQSLVGSVDDRLDQFTRKQIEQASLDIEINVDQLEAQRDAIKKQIAELDSPDPEDPLLNYLAQELSELEAQLVREQVRLETLGSIDPKTLFTLEELGDPVISLVGPNRKMSLAVAGVLGLFVGVLLAFFIHYLQNARKQRKES